MVYGLYNEALDCPLMSGLVQNQKTVGIWNDQLDLEYVLDRL